MVKLLKNYNFLIKLFVYFITYSNISVKYFKIPFYSTPNNVILKNILIYIFCMNLIYTTVMYRISQKYT